MCIRDRICSFEEDVFFLAKCLKKQSDIEIITEKAVSYTHLSTSFSKFAAVIFSSAMSKAPFCYLCLFFVFQLANPLRHGSHGAEGTPCTGLVEHHDDEADEQRGQHEAVKAEAELGYPVCHRSGSVGPAPRHTEGPRCV